MGHIFTDIMIRGSIASKELKKVMINTGATYMVLSREDLDEISA